EMLINTAKYAAPIYQEREGYGMASAEAFFCYIVSGQSDAAVELLRDLFEQAISYEDWFYISGLMRLQEEAERLPFVQPLLLTDKLWILRGLAHRALNEPDAALTDFNRAIEMNPESVL